MALLPVRQQTSMLPRYGVPQDGVLRNGLSQDGVLRDGLSRDGVPRDSTESTYRAGAPAGSARPTSAHSGVMNERPDL